MKIPMLDLKEQYTSIRNEIQNEMEKVMLSSTFILGENVKKIEKDLADYSNCKFGVGVGNGSDAIHIALQALGIQDGDEVITTPFTFFATGGAIVRANAKPVFVDIDEDTFNIDVKSIEKAITDKTKAIIPVHLYGQMANMQEIMEIANKYNLHVIEDAAQAIGATTNGIKVGEISSAATYSFFPTKNLGAYGDGGMIVTNNFEVNENSKVIRVHGSKPKYYHQVLGYNSRLDELQAAILNVKFPLLNSYSEARRERANYYNNLLNHVDKRHITIPTELEDNYHVYHQYTLRVADREGLKEYLSEHGISSMIYYPVPLHVQPVFSYLGYKEGDFPIAEKSASTALSLPMWPELKKEQQEYIVEKITEFYAMKK